MTKKEGVEFGGEDFAPGVEARWDAGVGCQGPGIDDGAEFALHVCEEAGWGVGVCVVGREVGEPGKEPDVGRLGVGLAG